MLHNAIKFREALINFSGIKESEVTALDVHNQCRVTPNELPQFSIHGHASPVDDLQHEIKHTAQCVYIGAGISARALLQVFTRDSIGQSC